MSEEREYVPYALIQTETRAKTGPNYAYNVKPDELWECVECGAAVRNREQHTYWHEEHTV